MTDVLYYNTMSLNLEIIKFIATLSEKKGSNITFEEFREEVTQRHPNIHFKEDEYLAILYYNDYSSDGLSVKLSNFEENCRSVVIDKESMGIVCTQYNKIIYNEDAMTFLEGKNWDNCVVQRCYEGTMLLVFNHKDTWYVTTRRCLNSDSSNWVKNKSYREMFDEAMENKFTFDELNKDCCYHFVLLHHKNRNIVNYGNFGKDYKELLHTLTTKKYTLDEVNETVNDNVKIVEHEKLESVKDLVERLENVNTTNQQYKKITMEGYIIRYYPDGVGNGPFTVLKLQTDIYQELLKLKPNNSNINQGYLELYQKDKLKKVLPYFTRYKNDVLTRMHTSMKTVAKEVLDLYHMTRQKKNPEVYNMLPEQYRKVLYGLHGLYIVNRKQDFSSQTDDKNSDEKETETKSINVHDVYHFLKKELKPQELRQLYYERFVLLKDEQEVKFINKNCLPTMTQSMLMFQTT